jgi:hypothetical protein
MNPVKMPVTPLQKMREFLSGYLHFADPNIVRPIALWVAGTYLYEMFDTFPYMVISASVKRAGKTRLSELIGFASSMPFNVAGATAASLFRVIQDNKPTVIWDEAESLSSEASSVTRAFLNVGYRKGQTIPRTTGKGVTMWPTYCPKVFVLIGEVYDTLRDRSIVVEMQRGEPKKRFSYEAAKMEGEEIGNEIKALVAENLEAIQTAYNELDLPFLTDRDAEIWRAIFALAQVLEPSAIDELQRTAVDMATAKTADIKKYGVTELKEQERIVEREEYGRRLLLDLLTVTEKLKSISSQDAVTALRDLNTAPWRKYKGAGLDMNMLADLLTVYELRPKLVRNGEKVFRGYTRKDILASVKKFKVSQ